jgi:hypothetical protein
MLATESGDGAMKTHKTEAFLHNVRVSEGNITSIISVVLTPYLIARRQLTFNGPHGCLCDSNSGRDCGCLGFRGFP